MTRLHDFEVRRVGMSDSEGGALADVLYFRYDAEARTYLRGMTCSN